MNSQSFSIVNMVLKILEKDTGVTRTACIRNRCRILFGLLRSIEIMISLMGTESITNRGFLRYFLY